MSQLEKKIKSLCGYLVSRPLRSILRVDHEQHVREPGPEIRSVSVVVSVQAALSIDSFLGFLSP